MAASLFLLRVLCLLPTLGGVTEAFSTIINTVELRGDNMEYHANYRDLPIASRDGMFRLVFFNTTPNAYALGISMGYSGQEETKMIVWSAKMNDLVTENATLNLTDDGNFVIFSANGSSVWSTNTSGRGVVGFELRNSGNLVFYDENYKMVWQTFDYPTDSLLVDQSLNIERVKKLVSRASEKDGSEGPYILALEDRGLVLYLNLNEQWNLPFYERGPRDSDAITHTCNKPVRQATFRNDPEAKHGFHHMIELTLANITAHELCNLTYEETNTVLYGFNTPRFNTKWSFLRLEPDGALKMYRYSQHDKWDITYLRSGCWQGVPQCDLARKVGGSMFLPRRCQCLACSQADGFKGSGSCARPADSKYTSSCNSTHDFYKLVGPEHFSSHHPNPNPIDETEAEECRRRCSHDDCYTCTAYLYWEQASACLHTKELGNNLLFIKKSV